MLSDHILNQLTSIVGESRLLLGADDLQHFGIDRTTEWQAAPSAVLLPQTVEEVQSIVRLANQHNLAIVPSGGRTGLSGGAVATAGELVVALDRLNKIIEFNPLDRSLTVGAGTITAHLQQFAERQSLFYPVDFASSGSSQIGGNIATNAGGIKVIKYGMTRNWVIGLKVVTGTGEILELNKGLAKNNTGYDLRHLFIGSEGTLGLICEATIQLTQRPPESTVMVLGVSDFAAIMDVLKCFSSDLDLSAFEFFSQSALEKLVAHRGHAAPFQTSTPFYALLEFASADQGAIDQAMQLFEHCSEQGWVLDAVISQSLTQAKNLWKLREDISDTLWQWQPYKNDISVRVSRMPDFIRQVDQLVAQSYPDFEVVWYGHIGDGNLHLNILKPEGFPVDEFHDNCVNVSAEMGQLLADYEGSVSAEHGVGLLKKEYLHYSRSVVEIDMMRSIKRVFDPNHIMNPGKVFD